MAGKYKLNSEKIMERMQELGMTYLAKMMGVEITTLEKTLKNEGKITYKTAETLAYGLELSLESFLKEGYVEKFDCSKNGVIYNKEGQQKLIAILTKNLRARQKYLQVSRGELGESTHISMREMGKLMNGQVNPRIFTVYCIAKALDVSIDELLTDGYDQTLV